MFTNSRALRTSWRHRPLIGALAAGAILLAACGGASFNFTSSSDDKAFFKVPKQWREYNRLDILEAAGQSESAATERAIPWLVAFDADPEPSVIHVLSLELAPEYPVVLAQTRALDFSTRDQISLGSLRNQLYPVDDLLQNDAAEIIAYEEVVLEDGFRGIEMTYDVLTQGISPVTRGNQVIRVRMMGILDAKTENLYWLAIRCRAECFVEHQGMIDQIAESWTVRER